MSVHKINRGRGTSFRVRWYDEHQQQHSKNFSNRRDAVDFDAQMKADKSRGLAVSRKMERTTFGEIARQWRHTKGDLRRPSLKRIDTILHRHLLPTLGDKMLSEVTRDVLQRLVNDWVDQGLRPRTIFNHRNVLVPILQLAVDEDIIPKNHATRLTYPKPGRVKRNPLTPEQANRLLENCDPILHPVVWLGLITGLRFNEIASLDVSDFNSSNRTISVRHSKTDAGIRSVKINEQQAQHLVELLEARSPDTRHSDFPLLISPRGRRLIYSNFRRRFTLTVERAGLSNVTFHDLRRTHATALVEAGTNPKVTQERMGHANIQTTLTAYASATQTGLEAASRVMENFLSPQDHHAF